MSSHPNDSLCIAEQINALTSSNLGAMSWSKGRSVPPPCKFQRKSKFSVAQSDVQALAFPEIDTTTVQEICQNDDLWNFDCETNDNVTSEKSNTITFERDMIATQRKHIAADIAQTEFFSSEDVQNGSDFWDRCFELL